MSYRAKHETSSLSVPSLKLFKNRTLVRLAKKHRNCHFTADRANAIPWARNFKLKSAEFAGAHHLSQARNTATVTVKPCYVGGSIFELSKVRAMGFHHTRIENRFQ
jgi:hypothetical protein